MSYFKDNKNKHNAYELSNFILKAHLHIYYFIKNLNHF